MQQGTWPETQTQGHLVNAANTVTVGSAFGIVVGKIVDIAVGTAIAIVVDPAATVNQPRKSTVYFLRNIDNTKKISPGQRFSHHHRR